VNPVPYPLFTLNKYFSDIFKILYPKYELAIDYLAQGYKTESAIYQSGNLAIHILFEYLFSSHRTVLKIGTKRTFGNWKQVDQVPLNQAKTDLENAQVAPIFAVNEMAQTLMNSAAARRD